MKTPRQLQKQRRTAFAKKSTQIFEGFEQFKAIPWTALWSLSLAIGGLFLVSYFASIEYLPDLKIEDLTVTIAAVAVVGMFLVVVVGLGLTLPILFLTPDGTLRKQYVSLQATLGVATAFAVFLNAAFDSGNREELWFAILAISALLSIWLAYRFSVQGRVSESVMAVISVALWAVWALIMPMFYYASIAHQTGDNDLMVWLKLFLFPVVFAFISIVLASLPDSHRGRFRLATAAGAMVLLSLFTSRPAFVPQTAVAVLGLSVDRKSVTLVLTESGCNAANLLLDKKPCAFDAATKLGSLLNVRIVSRIGTQFVIHWQPLALPGINPPAPVSAVSNGIWRRAILKKDDVVSWAYDFGK
jgi:hypothetical protein